MRTRVFTVSEDTWEEHRLAGLAAINDPCADSDSARSHATRQRVMTEISGIRPGDRLFFYVQRTKEIIGGFQATTRPFFDTSPLFPGAIFIDNRFPFRVGFNPVIGYKRPIHVNEIWAGRDAGKIWTMQQARGDVVGRHACWPLTRQEGDLLNFMLQELNVVDHQPPPVRDLPEQRSPLPLDLRLLGVHFPHMRYEASLQTLLLEGLAEDNWRQIFGKYDDFLPFVSTSEGKEIDVVLLHHDTFGNVIWYQLLELKSDRFRHDDLLQLLAYETWMTSSNQVGGNPRAVHMIALANRYAEEVLKHEAARRNLRQKPVRLLTYTFIESTRQIELLEIDPLSD